MELTAHDAGAVRRAGSARRAFADLALAEEPHGGPVRFLRTAIGRGGSRPFAALETHLGHAADRYLARGNARYSQPALDRLQLCGLPARRPEKNLPRGGLAA